MATSQGRKRPTCRQNSMSDKVALSDVMLFIVNHARFEPADRRDYCAWARRQNLPALPPDPQVLGLYIAACASGAAGPKPKNSVGTIERRLSALMWNFAQRGQPMDRKDR